MRKIEITEETLRDGTALYSKGDVKTVDDERAALWISLGWAKDAATGEQGERKPGAQAVQPDKVTQKTK